MALGRSCGPVESTRLCGQFSWVCASIADRDLFFQSLLGRFGSGHAAGGAWRALGGEACGASRAPEFVGSVVRLRSGALESRRLCELRLNEVLFRDFRDAEGWVFCDVFGDHQPKIGLGCGLMVTQRVCERQSLRRRGRRGVA